MKQPIQISAAPLLKSKAVIIECGLIVVERTSVRAKFGDVLRREIDELSEPPFALLDLLLRLLCRGDVHHRSDKLYEVAFLIDDRMHKLGIFCRSLQRAT